MIKVSIIVPIHNAGSRLKECLETLVNQSLREIEIICILGCPTDGSEKIAEEFATNDKRVKLIYNKTNIHLAASRNKGIENAIGEFIGFSDHDDTRSLNMYEELYNSALANRVDIVFSNSYIKTNNNDSLTLVKYNDISKHGIISSLIIPMNDARNPNYLSRCVWGSLYKNTFIKKYDIYFLDRRIYFEEDTLFNLMAFINAKSIYYSNNAYYTWHQENNGVSKTIITHHENVDRQLYFISKIIELLIGKDLLKLHKNELELLLANFFDKYFPVYKSLIRLNDKRLLGILKSSSYPLLGRYTQLKILSKKRVRLYLFTIQARLKIMLQQL